MTKKKKKIKPKKPTKLYLAKCKICGTLFLTSTKRYVYCSPKCYEKTVHGVLYRMLPRPKYKEIPKEKWQYYIKKYKVVRLTKNQTKLGGHLYE